MTPETIHPEEGAWRTHHGEAAVPLLENEIHLWRVFLDEGHEDVRRCEDLLQEDERERTARLRFPGHRERFILARGALRRILGVHLDWPPDEVSFVYGEHGKPGLFEPSETGVEFNVSHSGDVAIYAVSRSCCVGVDAELIRANGSWLEIAERYFAPEEHARLASLAADRMVEEFFRTWSEKEARLKAMGVGLRFSLDAENIEEWTTVRFTPRAGYAGALAYPSGCGNPAIVKHHFAFAPDAMGA